MTHKRCIACGAEHKASADTCSKCGEASWGVPYSLVVAAAPEPVLVEAPAEHPEKDQTPTAPVTPFARRNRRGK